MMRQMRKQMLTMLAVLAGFSLAALPVAAHAESLVTSIVTDPLTGVAIDGYDPVSYFTEVEPLQGTPDYDYEWGGVSWYFVNAANRDVFIRSPEVYAPQYGGHCVMSLSRGFLSDGKPRIYLIDRAKLYLFYSAANRDAFALSKAEALKTAAANWPELAKQLVGPASDLDPNSEEATDPASADGAAAPTQDAASTDAAIPAVAAAPAAGTLTSN